MPAITAPFTSEMLDLLAAARNADAALLQVDAFRLDIAGDSVFSIQQNVTTATDPVDEIRLQRFYSSEAQHYPVNGSKRKTLSPWTECLFRHGRVFVGEGPEVLERHFDDAGQMFRRGLQSVVNVPLMQGNTCFATFNVFGTRPHWQPQQVLGIRLLALAAARWVPVAPGLCYRFSAAPVFASQEA